MNLFKRYALTCLFPCNRYSAEQLVIQFSRAFRDHPTIDPNQAQKDLLNLTKGRNPILGVRREERGLAEQLDHPHLPKLYFHTLQKTLKIQTDDLADTERKALIGKFLGLNPEYLLIDSDPGIFHIEWRPLDDWQYEIYLDNMMTAEDFQARQKRNPPDQDNQ